MYRQSDDYGFFAKRVFIVHNRAQQPKIGGHTLSFSVLRRVSRRDTAAISGHCVDVIITRPASRHTSASSPSTVRCPSSMIQTVTETAFVAKPWNILKDGY